MQTTPNRVEPIMYLLFAGIFLSVGILLFAAYVWPADGQVFQVLASLLANFSGAFFARMIPRSTPTVPPGTTTIVAPADPSTDAK